MNTINGKLATLGPNEPSKIWKGTMPPEFWDGGGKKELVIELVIQQIFKNDRATLGDNYYSYPDLAVGTALLCLAFRSSPLAVLGSIGEGGRFLAPEKMPAPETTTAVRDALLTPGGGGRPAIHHECR